jgi:hypothetical protein
MSDIGHWWDSEHTFPGDAHNLELQPVLHSCLCEGNGHYGNVEHLHVVYVKPPLILRLTSALWSLQEFAAVRHKLAFRTRGRRSHVILTHNVSGPASGSRAPMADAVLSAVAEIRRFVASGISK